VRDGSSRVPPAEGSARPGRLRAAALVAAAEVALELPGDRLAGGLRQLGGVLGLLELAHVLGHLRVLLRELVDAGLPGAGLLDEVTDGERLTDELLEPA